MERGGFTLIEVLLSVAIITVLVGISLPVYETFVRRNDLDITAQNLVSALRRAQVNARAVQGDATWGVAIQSSNIVLFKGASYATRDASFDEITAVPGAISSSGTSELQFAKMSGAPNAAGSFVLASTTNDTRTVTVNVEGAVDY